MDISIINEVAGIQNDLDELKIYIKDFPKQALKKITSKGRAKMRAAYKKSGLKIKTGRLFKGIYGVAKTNIGYIGETSKQAYKFLPLTQGYKINAKRDYMRFQVNGKWVAVKSVQQKAHDYFDPAKKYVESEEMNNDIDILLERLVKKAFK